MQHAGIEARAWARHDIGDEPARRAANGNRGLGDIRAGTQHQLDARRLDAAAPQLELRIDAAEESERSVVPPDHQIAGSIGYLRGARDVEAGEVLGGELVEVAITLA